MHSTAILPRPHLRAPRLAKLRRQKMAQSAHAYVRGSTIAFYRWLDAESDAVLPAGPPVWICGDCHLGNLGPLADVTGAIEVQVRDLDQTVIGNPAHDLVRLGLSLASVARGSDLSGITTARMLESMSEGYVAGLSGRGVFDTSKRRPKLIRELLKVSGHRKWRHLATERLENVHPSIPLGKRFWPLSATEKRQLEALFTGPEMREHLGHLLGRKDPRVEVLDAAYWVKGCSSLGRLRYAVLARIGKKGAQLFDVKEATTAAAPRDPDADMPRDNAERIVTGARALSPYLGERMMAARIEGRSVVIRELLPQDLKLEAEQLTWKGAVSIARYLAGVLGLAHGRQMSAADRRQWIAELRRRRSKNIDVPSWLWKSVIDLIAVHELEYLEHCRRIVAAK